MTYQLYYWDGMPGRGEFIRLALEEAGADYVDVVRGPGGTAAMMEIMESRDEPTIPFAPPFLRDGDVIVSQVANILLYLGPKLGLAPQDEALRYAANGLQLTITDFLVEIHNTHHPIATSLYYEQQEDAAKAYSVFFLKERLPKFLGYFERVLRQNPSGDKQIIGDRLSYVDLSLFQVIEGLLYAFPRAMRGYATEYRALAAIHETVRERPNIKRYLASDRRLAFNETGLFRHYPELDQDSA